MAQKVNPRIFRLGKFQECKLKSFSDRHQKYVEELVSHAIFETERMELPANPGNTYILQSFWRSVQSHSGQFSQTVGVSARDLCEGSLAASASSLCEAVGLAELDADPSTRSQRDAKHHATSGYTMQRGPKRSLEAGLHSSLCENHSAKAIALRFHEKKQRNHRGLFARAARGIRVDGRGCREESASYGLGETRLSQRLGFAEMLSDAPHPTVGLSEAQKIEHLDCRKLAYKWVWFESPDPMMNASLICDQIVQMFESQSTPNFRKLWPKIAASTSGKAIQGVKVCCSGRLEGAEMARVETRKLGRTSAQKLSEKLDFASKKAITLYGSIGVKVWIAYK